MAYIRRLPSGNWQATVRHPNGDRITKTDPLKTVVKDWAIELEVQFKRGDRRDPRSGQIAVGEWKQQWWPTRSIEESTSNKDEGHWRAYCQPEWETWPMESISRTDAQNWVDGLKKRKVRKGRHRNSANPPSLAADTVHGIVHVMSGMYAAAMKGRRLLSS